LERRKRKRREVEKKVTLIPSYLRVIPANAGLWNNVLATREPLFRTVQQWT
jgi:hypothetical protein